MFGAEALQHHITEQAKDEQWVELEWCVFNPPYGLMRWITNVARWKLHLCAKHLAASHTADDDLPPIPFGKSALDVLC